jgi:hypothetical protein
MSNKEGKFDLRKSLKEFQENPRKGLVRTCGVVLTIAVLGIVSGIQGWVGDRAKDTMTAACGWAHFSICAGSEKEPDQSSMLVFSTHVPNCLIGRIAYKFRNWTPTPDWENGADRLVVCTDASEPVSKSDLPETLQKLVLTVCRLRGRATRLLLRRLSTTQLSAAPPTGSMAAI